MSIWGIIGKICLAAAVVYYIWQERNWRLFNNHKRTEKEVFEAICGDVRSRLISIPPRDTQNIAKGSYQLKVDAGYGLDILQMALYLHSENLS
ncbi:hypothetical protein Tco_0111119 [Tanacetum coccineum]